MNYMITESIFNVNSVFLAQGIELKSEFYLKQLEALKMFYDESRYSEVKQILKAINEFMRKYLEDARTSSIAKMNLANERRALEQETDFISEEISYFKKNGVIKNEIEKIRDKFQKDLVSIVSQLYEFEESSYRLLEDICKEIGYYENISIKKMIWQLT